MTKELRTRGAVLVSLLAACGPDAPNDSTDAATLAAEDATVPPSQADADAGGAASSDGGRTVDDARAPSEQSPLDDAGSALDAGPAPVDGGPWTPLAPTPGLPPGTPFWDGGQFVIPTTDLLSLTQGTVLAGPGSSTRFNASEPLFLEQTGDTCVVRAGEAAKSWTFVGPGQVWVNDQKVYENGRCLVESTR